LRVAFHNAVDDWARERERLLREEPGAEKERLRQFVGFRDFWRMAARPVSVVRAIFEFLVPIIVAMYAAILLFSAPAPSTAASTRIQEGNAGTVGSPSSPAHPGGLTKEPTAERRGG
jgi:hypothetical protein